MVSPSVGSVPPGFGVNKNIKKKIFRNVFLKVLGQSDHVPLM